MFAWGDWLRHRLVRARQGSSIVGDMVRVEGRRGNELIGLSCVYIYDGVFVVSSVCLLADRICVMRLTQSQPKSSDHEYLEDWYWSASPLDTLPYINHEHCNELCNHTLLLEL